MATNEMEVRRMIKEVENLIYYSELLGYDKVRDALIKINMELYQKLDVVH